MRSRKRAFHFFASLLSKLAGDLRQGAHEYSIVDFCVHEIGIKSGNERKFLVVHLFLLLRLRHGSASSSCLVRQSLANHTIKNALCAGLIVNAKRNAVVVAEIEL